MSIENGSKLGPYKVVGPLGAGGMGEVYRALDTKLDREVAIKVLPESMAHNPERVARFEREAKVLAQLNHPMIAAIYGFDEADGQRFLVLELVEGPTLADRLADGRLPVEECVDIGRQIAEALEVAHDKGIIHRDLKPANVKLTAEGEVKVLDFGLAKALAGEEISLDPTTSPTITEHFTAPGMILGTAAYMSPEQARGRMVDNRSDIWSFGVVLFECLTGARGFGGETVPDTIGAVLHKDPDWTLLPKGTPLPVKLLLHKCLAKDRKHRLHHIADARVDLEQAIADPSDSSIPSILDGAQQSISGSGKSNRSLIAIFLLTIVSAIVATWLLKPTAKPLTSVAGQASVKRFDLMFKEGFRLSQKFERGFALSSDGNTLAYVLENQQGIHLRKLSTGDDHLLFGTEGLYAGGLFFSADGDAIGFVAGDTLSTIPVTGGKPREIVPSGLKIWKMKGADWNRDGQIVFAHSGRLLSVSDQGGEVKDLTNPEVGERHEYPHFLDDGQWVAYHVSNGESDSESGHIEVVNSQNLQKKTLDVGPCEEVCYTASGHLLCLAGSEVYAVAFDLAKLEPVGPRRFVLGGVRKTVWAQFQVADDGTVVYLPGHDSSHSNRGLFWLDANAQISPCTQQRGPWIGMALSPDGRRVALVTEEENTGDIWLLDTEGGTPPRPLVKHPAADHHPVWSADSEFVYFYSDRETPRGTHGIWRKKASFEGPPEELVYASSDVVLEPTSASDDLLTLTRPWEQERGAEDIWILRLDQSNAQPEPFLDTSERERDPCISPDGQWLAYSSYEPGFFAVYVVPMDRSSPSQIVSSGTGLLPAWSGDGKKLFWYETGDYWFREWSANGTPAGDPQFFVDVPFMRGGFNRYSGKMLWPSFDGGRVLQLASDAQGVELLSRTTDRSLTLRVITGWFNELNEKVPRGQVKP